MFGGEENRRKWPIFRSFSQFSPKNNREGSRTEQGGGSGRTGRGAGEGPGSPAQPGPFASTRESGRHVQLVQRRGRRLLLFQLARLGLRLRRQPVLDAERERNLGVFDGALQVQHFVEFGQRLAVGQTILLRSAIETVAKSAIVQTCKEEPLVHCGLSQPGNRAINSHQQ